MSKAKAQLEALLDRLAVSHRPLKITGKRNSAVLIAQSDWNSVQETLYLMFLPGMRESIRKGLKTPVKRCVERLW